MSNKGTTMRIAPLALLAALALAAAPGAASAQAPGHVARLADGSIDPGVLAGVPVASASLRHRDRTMAPMTVRQARRAGFRPVAELVGGAYPTFSPGIGAVYAKRGTLPLGPFIAFDHKGRQVATIYKFPLGKMNDRQRFEAPGVRMPPVDHMSGYFGGSHPGVDFPHYNCVFWHVPKKDESRVAN